MQAEGHLCGGSAFRLQFGRSENKCRWRGVPLALAHREVLGQRATVMPTRTHDGGLRPRCAFQPLTKLADALGAALGQRRLCGIERVQK
jgi:hypothetical protein